MVDQDCSNYVVNYIISHLQFDKEVLTDLLNILEPLLYVHITAILYSVSLCNLLIVYIEPPTVSGCVTLPDIVTLCDTSPQAG